MDCFIEEGYELKRFRITLEELLGEGQFGDVYRGKYESEVVFFWVKIERLVDL